MKKKKLWVQGFVTAWNHARLVIPPLYLVSERTYAIQNHSVLTHRQQSLSFLCDMKKKTATVLCNLFLFGI